MTFVLQRFPQGHTDFHYYGAIKFVWCKRVTVGHYLWAFYGLLCPLVKDWEYFTELLPARSHFQPHSGCFPILPFLGVHLSDSQGRIKVAPWKFTESQSPFESITTLLQFFQFASCNWLLFQTQHQNVPTGLGQNSCSKVQSLTMRVSRCVEKRIRMCSATQPAWESVVW